MNDLATTKSARRVRRDRWQLAPRRRGGANPAARRRLLLEPLEHRTLLSAGDLDPTFGDGGRVLTDFGYIPCDDYGADVVAVQSDGKVVVVGNSYVLGTGTRRDFTLVRYNSDGSLDTSFGTDGKVSTNFDYANYDSEDYAQAVAIYPDGDGPHAGKIVVAGYSRDYDSDTGYDFALARYNSDGSLDNSFDDDGKLTTDFAGSTDQAYGVAIDADGKIVVAGYSQQGGTTGYDFALARYNDDGSLDTTFDPVEHDGKVTTDFGGSYDQAYDLAIHPGDGLQAGKIVVVGHSNAGATYDFALARYNGSDGSLDTSFGTGGKVVTDFGGTSDQAYGATIDDAGQIVVVGSSYSQTTRDDFALARYNAADGSLDASLDGDDGMVTIHFGGLYDYAQDVAIDSAGRILLAGRCQPGYSFATDFALACYDPGIGGLDTGFGQDLDGDGVPDGKVVTDFGSSTDYGSGVALVEGDKIVVAGYSYQGSVWDGGTGADFALARYTTDGNLDDTFGTDGKVLTDIGKPGTTDYGRGLVAAQSDGKILVVGNSYQGSSSYGGTYQDFALARYNSDGSLDTTFGNGGKVLTDLNNRSYDYATAVAVYAEGPHAGKIVVAGYSYQGTSTRYDFALARYNTDGSLDDGSVNDSDPSDWFGTGGKVTTDFGADYDYAYGVAMHADGKIVVAGYSYQGSPWEGGTGYDFALARYNPDGSLDDGSVNDSDPSDWFGTGGLVTTDFGSDYDNAYGVAIDGGQIVVAGLSYQGYLWEGGTDYDFALARYNSDGALDTTFGTGGLVTTDFGSTSDYPYDVAYGVAIDGAGQIVVAGYSYQGDPWEGGTGYDFALARYNSSDGSVDTTFGTGGLVTTDFGSYIDYAYGVVIDAAGKIVVAGYSSQSGSGYDFALARYEVDFGVGAITAPTDPVEVNTVMNASAIFTDRDVTRTHTAFWDWGDSTASAGTVDETAGTVAGSHSYTAAGVYTVTLTVNAIADGSVVDSDQSVYQYVVAFDPSAGFVTGAGWFDSPQGAYVPRPWLTDRANFAFVSKYQNGADTPDGNTIFRFKAGDLDFRSSSYQWLVVAGSHAKFKGTGTIGGSGDYGFMITATDGQISGGDGADAFRIKIWDRATDTIVYDNQPGEADDCNAGTAISAGNIIVHDGRDALHAAGGASGGIVGATLAQATLTPVVEKAMSYWAGEGVGADSLAELGAIDVRVADLSPSVLGIASSSNLIWIDRDAAGYGWNDPLGTPGSTAAGMDLLSVVTHEFGHKLGFDHGDEHDVMAATLAPGDQTVTTTALLREDVFAVQHVDSLGMESSPSNRNVPLWFPTDTASFQTLHTQWAPAEKSQALRMRDEFFAALALDRDQAAAVDARLRDGGDHQIAMEAIGDLSEFLAHVEGQEEPEDEVTESAVSEDLVEMPAAGL